MVTVLVSLRNSYLKRPDDYILEFFKHLANTHSNDRIRKYASQHLEICSKSIRIGGQTFDFRVKPSEPIIANVDLADFTQIDWKELANTATSLQITESNVKSLNGIDMLRKLRRIDASDIQLENIDAMANCPELEYLDLSKNNIEDISALGSLSKLQYLNLSQNKISEIPVLNTPLLKKLDLKENRISEIKGLQHMIALEFLSLSLNNISEISGLESLHSLKELRLIDNQISEVRGFQALTYCRKLWLVGNPLHSEFQITSSAKDWIAMCGGNPAPTLEIQKDAPNVIPLEHGILIRNLDGTCLYCGKSIRPGKSEDSKCAADLEKLLKKAEKWIPQRVKGREGVVDTKRVQRLHNLGHGAWRVITETVDITKQPDFLLTERLSGVAFESLTGTLCLQCKDSFINETEAIFIRLKGLKKEVKKLEKDGGYSFTLKIAENRVSNVIFDYGHLVDRWIVKAILRIWNRPN